MSLKAQLDHIFKESMKSGDSLKVSVIRLLRSQIKNREIDKRGDLVEDEVMGILSTAVKQRRDSIEQFARGGREDLVQKETHELEFLLTFLPRPLTSDELHQEVVEAIKSVGAIGPQDMGKVMKVLVSRLKGRADGGVVQSQVKELLQRQSVSERPT